VKTYYVTKKKYDWIVRCDGEEFGLWEEADEAVDSARARARADIAAGADAEVLMANTVGMWDRIAI
jgi:hypothetical protein